MMPNAISIKPGYTACTSNSYNTVVSQRSSTCYSVPSRVDEVHQLFADINLSIKEFNITACFEFESKFTQTIGHKFRSLATCLANNPELKTNSNFDSFHSVASDIKKLLIAHKDQLNKQAYSLKFPVFNLGAGEVSDLYSYDNQNGQYSPSIVIWLESIANIQMWLAVKVYGDSESNYTFLKNLTQDQAESLQSACIDDQSDYSSRYKKDILDVHFKNIDQYCDTNSKANFDQYKTCLCMMLKNLQITCLTLLKSATMILNWAILTSKIQSFQELPMKV